MRPRIMFGRTTVAAMLAKTSELTGIPVTALMAKNADEDSRLARFAIMLAGRRSGRTTTQIARVLDLHHTTVMHGSKRAEELEKDDEDFAELVRLLRPDPTPLGFAPLLPPHAAFLIHNCERSAGGQSLVAHPQAGA